MANIPVVRIPAHLSDDALVRAAVRLAHAGRQTGAWLVAHLAELDSRRLYLGAGCPSLFIYCTHVLRLSESEAYNRIEAARLARKFPQVLGMLAEGALTLTTARLLGPHLTAENHDELFTGAAGHGKRYVERFLARLFPLPDVPTSIRKVPVSRGVAAISVPVADVAAPTPLPIAEATAGVLAVDAPTPIAVTKRPVVLRPLSENSYEIRFTAPAATREKLAQATDLLRHAIPDGSVAEVIDRALTVLLRDLGKRKFGAPKKEKTDRRGRTEEVRRPVADQAPGPRRRVRHIAARVRRAVWVRDGGRCAFVGTAARRCGERAFLEFHHVRPHAVGGGATVENIELRCRSHNAFESELYFGTRWEHQRDRAEAELDRAPRAVELVPERAAAP